MQRSRTRLTAAAVSTVLSMAAGAAFLVWWNGRAPVDLRFHETGDLSALRLEREVYAGERPPADAAGPRDPRARDYFLSEEHASKLFAIASNADVRRYDPWCYYLSAPNRDQKVAWPEHDKGGYQLRTNSDGLRDDEFDPAAERDLFVLAAGDSHTFGVCHNHETWPNRLELDLRKRFRGRRIDVLNTGMGGYSLYHYLGVLEKYLDVPPDAFVVAVYGGNDFTELESLRRVLEDAEPLGRLTPEESRLRREAANAHRAAMGQCFNATWTLTQRPHVAEPLVATALDLVARMKAICDERGILFVVALIPAPCEMDWDPPMESFDRLRAMFSLTDEDCGVLDRVADRFVAGLDELGVTAVDMRPTYEALEQPPYWRRDKHLDVTGHALLAEALEPIVAGWAAETGRLADE